MPITNPLHPWDSPPPIGRTDYPHNVGGALSYYATLFVRGVLDRLGDTISDILSSVFTRFLHLIEPEMTRYVNPIIDELLAVPELPPSYRNYLTSLKTPASPVVALLAPLVVAVFSAAIVPGAVGPVAEKVRHAFNKLIRPNIPTPGDAIGIGFRSPEAWGESREVLKAHGYTDVAIDRMINLARQRPDIGTLMHYYHIELGYRDTVVAELRKRGMVDNDINLFIESSRRQFDVSEIITAWRRRTIAEDEVNARLRRLGYDERAIGLVKEISQAIPSWGEITRMAVRDAWRDDIASKWGYDEDFPSQAAEWGEKQGYSRDWLKRYWRAHWEMPSPQMMFEMMHREQLTPTELREALKIADYPSYWREKLVNISYSPYTRVDVRRMYGLGVLPTRAEVKRAYMDIGYDDNKAEHLTEFTVRYEDDDGSNKVARMKELTQAQLSKAFREGHIDQIEYRTQLSRIKYTADDINWLVSYNQFANALDLAPDLRKEYRSEMTSIIERAFVNKLISEGQFKEWMAKLGYGDRDVSYLRTHALFTSAEKEQEEQIKAGEELYARGLMDRSQAVAFLGQMNIPGEMQTEILRRWDFTEGIKTRQLTESELRQLMQYEVIDLDTYCNELRGLGYAERYVEWKKRLWIKRTTPEETL